MVRVISIVAVLALSLTSALAAPGPFFAASALESRQDNACNSGQQNNGQQNNGQQNNGQQNTGDRVTTVNAGAAAVGKGNGSQFTVGPCVDDADCGTGCCAGGAVSGMTGRDGVGVCSGVGAGVEFQKGKTGCGFDDPNRELTLQEAAAQVEKQGF